MPLRMQFKLRVFQNRRFSEEVLTPINEFASPEVMALSLAHFASRQVTHDVRWDETLRESYSDAQHLDLPALHDGYGPETVLTIIQVIPINDR